MAYGHVRDVEVSGALAQNIGLANTAGFDIVYVQQPLPLTARRLTRTVAANSRCTSTFCVGTDIAANNFCLDTNIVSCYS